MKTINKTAEWQRLEQHFSEVKNYSMVDLFTQDPQRFEKFSSTVGEILFDYSKNRLTSETLTLLVKLADTADLGGKISRFFQGEKINTTEKRAVLHTLLRKPATPNTSNPQEIEVVDALQKMRIFSDKIRNGLWLGFSGKRMTDIVNIGIGGSHLGPLLTTEALAPYATADLRCHFISNIDDVHLKNILKQLNPETTLFIISSKSFNTIETQTNAATVKTWFELMTTGAALDQHFVAVTAAYEKARRFGIHADAIFPIWDWVGGRYSVWSAIGLPLALMIGMDNFCDFLAGAAAMDEHFRTADFRHNMPVLLALIGIWYVNFFHAPTKAIIPYSDLLNSLPNYLQQADMESNGKSVNHLGDPVPFATGPIVWGGQGCNGQHAYYQLLHQGQHLVPIDFILVANPNNNLHHDMLVSSALSQAQALMQGKSYKAALAELLEKNVEQSEAEWLAKHKTLPGNKPSNTLFLRTVSPRNLGALIAFYEQQIFVQGAIWDINSYDQWGVELGKQLLPDVMSTLTQNIPLPHDSSTLGLINYYREKKSSDA